MPEPTPDRRWSGATFTSLVDEYGRRFVLKRTSLETDWIARATKDHALREGWFAALPPGALAWIPLATTPYLGAAADGDGVAILTPALSNELIAWERPGHDPAIDVATLDRVLRALARIHACLGLSLGPRRTLGMAPPRCVRWPERLNLLARSSAAAYRRMDTLLRPVPRRWDAFAARLRRCSLTSAIARQRSGPLTLALECCRGRLPVMSSPNVAAAGRAGRVLDCRCAAGAVAIDLGWFLVSNSGPPVGPDEWCAATRCLGRDERQFRSRTRLDSTSWRLDCNATCRVS